MFVYYFIHSLKLLFPMLIYFILPPLYQNILIRGLFIRSKQISLLRNYYLAYFRLLWNILWWWCCIWYSPHITLFRVTHWLSFVLWFIFAIFIEVDLLNCSFLQYFKIVNIYLLFQVFLIWLEIAWSSSPISWNLFEFFLRWFIFIFWLIFIHLPKVLVVVLLGELLNF